MNEEILRRRAWDKINNAVDGRVYTHLWCVIAESFYQHRNRDYWVRVADRVGSRNWEPFSPSPSITLL